MKSRLIPILITGFVLALGLLLAVQVTHSLRGGKVSPPASNELPEGAFNQTVVPVIFKSISEQDDKLRISGTSEPAAVISVRNDGQNFRQIKANASGQWSITLNIENDPAMIIDLVVFVENGAKVRSDETLLRVPAPKTIELSSTEPNPPALIMITAPGGPTRIVQSPFRGLPTVGPISMGPIEYDDSGSVIFSGTSEAAGRVRILANDVIVGERPVSANGRWFFIAVETLPLGSYPITAELQSADGTNYQISVPFERLKFTEETSSGRALRVNYEPAIWQVSRNIYGGGRQYTAIFAPIEELESAEDE